MSDLVFVPQAVLDLALDDGVLDLDGEQLVVDGWLRLQGTEAVRVINEVVSGSDPLKLCGQVRSLEAIIEMGAELLGHSLIIGDAAYDVVSGMLLENKAKDEARPKRFMDAMESLQQCVPEAT